MKNIFDKLFSLKTAIILMFTFAIAMGIATFVEDSYDTYTAKLFIYGAKWFEFQMILLSISFIGNIVRFKMLRKGKLSGLIFHLALIVMILGAGITRYVGFEGTMHIREGQSSNIMYNEEVHLRIMAEDQKKTYTYEQAVLFNENSDNNFDIKIPTEGLGEISVKLKKIVPNAIERISENNPDGVDMMKITAMINKKTASFLIPEGKTKKIGNIALAYNTENQPNAININVTDKNMTIKSPVIFNYIPEREAEAKTIKPDSLFTFKENRIIAVNNEVFFVEKIYKKAKEVTEKGRPNNNRPDALIFNVSVKGKNYELKIYGGQSYYGNYRTYDIGENKIRFAYGMQPIELPFSLKLEKFILDRYAGSMSPSSYESEVVLIDKKAGIEEKHRIYMNNVLDYKGFRFFQSSYDQDEKGTILSVNHDALGTWTSYLGYFLLGAGFFFVFFSKESRFAELRKKIKKLQIKRKQAMLTIILILSSIVSSSAQTETRKPVSEKHADKFGLLVVQTYSGRFAPLQTLASDVMHKISRMDKFETAEKGELTKMQVFLDIQIDPEFWKKQKIIYVREESVREALGMQEKHASFLDFFDDKSQYKLRKFSEEASRKKPVNQNKFDREIIKVDERINIFMMTLQGAMTKIFPLQNSQNNDWISAGDSLAYLSLTGTLSVINEDLDLKNFNYANFMNLYLVELVKSVKTGDYSKPDKLIGYIEIMQNQKSNIEGFPNKTQLKFEVFYNNANIFIFLRNIYGMLSMLLLIFAFVDNLRAKRSRIVTIILNILISLLATAFLYHTFGMALRWYLTGHAPWSNGYEALILVAWGGLIAGFGFMRNSKITLAASVLMAFFMLMTAGHSSYDPQLTNLQPVLKSYWLIIHVATLTISYGFLGSGFLLGLINIILYIFKNKKNKERFDSVIKELSYINEMLLSLGLFLATIGTFLGGIWANESWGRYWGWDAKETWALVIVMVYAAVLHFRLIPKLKNLYFLNVGSILAFGTVLMTFIGVNYYLSKGMHSYASGETPIFPLWAWGLILTLFGLIAFAGFKELGEKDD